jgi:hypothetical protein
MVQPNCRRLGHNWQTVHLVVGLRSGPRALQRCGWCGVRRTLRPRPPSQDRIIRLGGFILTIGPNGDVGTLP